MKADVCNKCTHYKTCKKPCKPVELYLAENNHVFEKSYTDKNGKRVKIVFSNYKVYPESVITQEYDKSGKPDNKRTQQAFSTENESALSSFEPGLKTTGVFRDRFFLGFSYEDLGVKYGISVESARKTYHHGEQRIYKLLKDLDSKKRDLSYWEKMTSEKVKGMRQDVKIFLMHYVFELRPAEIQKLLNIKSLSYVSRQIKKVTGQLQSGKISLADFIPAEKKKRKSN